MTQRFVDFVSLINIAYKDLQKVKSSEMENLGLKGNHVMCIFYLGSSEEGLTSIELCAKCREDKAAVSRTLKTLTDMGYVTTSDGGDKKYRLKNVLTDSGREIYKKVEELAVGAVKKFGKGLNERERNTFYKALKIIVQNFDMYCDNID